MILEGGGQAAHFLAAWQAWRLDPEACWQLHFISIAAQPTPRSALQVALRDSPLHALAEQLVAAWPPLTPNLHRLSFEGGRVQLLLAFGRLIDWLPEIVASIDAFVLDDVSVDDAGAQPRLSKALARLAAPDATLCTRSAGPALRSGLQSAGFRIDTPPGGGDAAGTMTVAHFAPTFVPRRAPGRSPRPASPERNAIIIGAGLAGCAAAWALAEQGWRTTLLERHATLAGEASGNPAGLFHGIVNAQDGTHARFNRAAALEARTAVQIALKSHGAAGSAQGLLRLETGGASARSMRATLDRLGLPADYVLALSADEASARSGLSLRDPAWFYPGGGWVEPAGLARAYLQRAGAAATLRTGVEVNRLRRAGTAWELLDAAGAVIETSHSVVLANSCDALRLLGLPAWPVERVRGQISVLRDASALQLPRVPVTGSGYLLPAIGQSAIWGATAQRGDRDPAVRASDHRENLAQLVRLLGAAPAVDLASLTGRTAWRCVSNDRLPIVGAVPALPALPALPAVPETATPDNTADGADQSSSMRLEQPRCVPRLPGLFVYTALGSRGITWSALAAQVLASTLSGAPAPVEASLLDALDPARFITRRRRAAASAAARRLSRS